MAIYKYTVLSLSRCTVTPYYSSCPSSKNSGSSFIKPARGIWISSLVLSGRVLEARSDWSESFVVDEIVDSSLIGCSASVSISSEFALKQYEYSVPYVASVNYMTMASTRTGLWLSR